MSTPGRSQVLIPKRAARRVVRDHAGPPQVLIPKRAARRVAP